MGHREPECLLRIGNRLRTALIFLLSFRPLRQAPVLAGSANFSDWPTMQYRYALSVHGRPYCPRSGCRHYALANVEDPPTIAVRVMSQA
ncbi:hypothetical protein BDW68DRAFT_153745 [Aspergillus falconensis]